uniref:Uncharacterized protein n=1 Tax=Anguilla anguilla TaxID=7936 RepID=A0A0E9RX60_ANGAN
MDEVLRGVDGRSRTFMREWGKAWSYCEARCLCKHYKVLNCSCFNNFRN